jgi:hypothetical protein
MFIDLRKRRVFQKSILKKKGYGHGNLIAVKSNRPELSRKQCDARLFPLRCRDVFQNRYDLCHLEDIDGFFFF